MSHNLTIDFNDASFDEASNDVQPVPGVTDIDVVFPISDDQNFAVAQADNRTTTATPASSIALMPDQAKAGVMEEFLFEFDNSIDHDDDVATPNVQGLRITTEGYDGSKDVITDINLAGTFNNLTDGGTLDVYVNKGEVDHDSNPTTAKIPVFEKFSLGAPTANSGDDMAILVSGDMNGADMGGGSDMAMINVDASADMDGLFQGGNGPGMDVLTLVEGVVQDNGARVDFGFGDFGVNSALVTNQGGIGSGLNFQIAGWEVIQLTDNADTVIIGSGTGSGLTDAYDAAYLNAGADNSMLKLMSGYTDGSQADVMNINASSNIYLSFDFVDTNQGISAVFGTTGNVNVDDLGGTGPEIDVDVIKTGGTGLAIDYIEGTQNADIVTNLGANGITVNLGGSNGAADKFIGSQSSKNDVLDAREAHTLGFAEGAGQYIDVTGVSELGSVVKASLLDVDYIMVRDDVMSNITDEAQIWDQVGTADVDFYRDMSHLNGKYVITDANGNGLGAGASDAYGKGYDVMTSAQVDSFGTGSGSKDLRVYYEGEHDDFIDTDDNVIVNSADGTVVMSDGDSTRGSTWEGAIAGQYGPGQSPGFYIEVSNKKLAVTFDDTKGEWKVDTTAIQVAEGATSAISAANSSTVLSGSALADVIAAQFGIHLKMVDAEGKSVNHNDTKISNDIYLNATEEAITELLAGGVQKESYNFDFYTKVDLKAEDGNVTVNVKLAESSGSFTLNFADLDVAVESFHNVVEDTGAAISSSSAAGEFVKIDNSGDLALGNGGDDTYVIGAADGGGIYGGVALEYGNIGSGGGLTGSIDAVNINSVDSVDDLTFRRGKYRNEEEGSTLFIGDGSGNETVLFDNYNEYLDFRRVEYLTVEDGANNNEVYEIVANNNLGGWDNEIYVSDGGTTAVELGGIDYVIGADGSQDTFDFKLADIISAGSENSVVKLSNLSSSDGDTLVATDASKYMSSTDKGLLEAALAQGISDGVSEVRFSYNDTTDKLTLGIDSLTDVTYNLDLYSS